MAQLYQPVVGMNAAQRKNLEIQQQQADWQRTWSLINGLAIQPGMAVLGKALDQWQTPLQNEQTKSLAIGNEGAAMELEKAKAYERWLDDPRSIPGRYIDTSTGRMIDAQTPGQGAPDAGALSPVPVSAASVQPAPYRGPAAMDVVGRSMFSPKAAPASKAMPSPTVPPAPAAPLPSQLKLNSQLASYAGQANAQPFAAVIPAYRSPVASVSVPALKGSGRGVLGAIADAGNMERVAAAAGAQNAGAIKKATPRDVMYATQANAIMDAFEAPAKAGYAATVAALQKQDEQNAKRWLDLETLREKWGRQGIDLDTAKQGARGAGAAAYTQLTLYGLKAARDSLEGRASFMLGGVPYSQATPDQKVSVISDTAFGKMADEYARQVKAKTGVEMTRADIISSLGMSEKNIANAAKVIADRNKTAAAADIAAVNADRAKKGLPPLSAGKPGPTAADVSQSETRGARDGDTDFFKIAQPLTAKSGMMQSTDVDALVNEIAPVLARLNDGIVKADAEGDAESVQYLREKKAQIGRRIKAIQENPDSFSSMLNAYNRISQ